MVPRCYVESGQIVITAYLDSDHARDIVTRRSVTGFLICLNRTIICWYSKRQNTVETATYGAELEAATYIKTVCEKIEKLYDTKLKNVGLPLEAGNHPEMDESDFLYREEISKYQMLCGCAQWAVSIARWDIQFAVNSMARFASKPREGHLKRMLRIFGYLKYHAKGRIKIDMEAPNYDNLKFTEYDWTQHYPEAFEEIPMDAPEPKVKSGQIAITAYLNSDHAQDIVTRRSVTGFLMCL